MIKRLIFTVYLVFFVIAFGISQSFFFGIKGGPSIGYQKWENFNQKPVLTYHIASFIESYSEENPMNTLYAQLGYHNRGSALRGALGYTIDGNVFRLPTRNFLFHNISLGLGAKRKQQLKEDLKSFYSFGLRAEYTISTNLDKFAHFNQRQSYPYYPDNIFVKKFVYGAQVGGGVEYVFSELVELLIELSINPDLSNQYLQPEIGSIVDPYHPNNTITLRKRRIKNVTVEISFGFRFMRKVEYVD